MTPAVRYAALELAYGSQWVGPLLLSLAGAAALNASDPGPLVPATGPALVLVLAVSTWSAQAGLRRSDQALSDVAAAAAGGSRPLLLARSGLRLGLSALLATVVLGWTCLAVNREDGPSQILTSGIALSAGCLLGHAIGTLTAPPVVPSLGYGTVAAVGAVVLLAITHGSPVHTLLNALLDDVEAMSVAAQASGVALAAALCAVAVAERRATRT